jgi:hypothetical protein
LRCVPVQKDFDTSRNSIIVASAPVGRASFSCYGHIVNIGFVALKGP